MDCKKFENLTALDTEDPIISFEELDYLTLDESIELFEHALECANPEHQIKKLPEPVAQAICMNYEIRKTEEEAKDVIKQIVAEDAIGEACRRLSPPDLGCLYDKCKKKNEEYLC